MTYAGAGATPPPRWTNAALRAAAGQAATPAFGALIRRSRRADGRRRGYQLSTANALWGQKGYAFKADSSSSQGRLRRRPATRSTSRAPTERPARRSTPGSRSKPTTRSRTCSAGHPRRRHAAGADQRHLLQGRLGQPFKKGRDQMARSTRADKKADAPLMHQTGEFSYFGRRRRSRRWNCPSGQRSVDGGPAAEEDGRPGRRREGAHGREAAGWRQAAQAGGRSSACRKFKTTQNCS